MVGTAGSKRAWAAWNRVAGKPKIALRKSGKLSDCFRLMTSKDTWFRISRESNDDWINFQSWQLHAVGSAGVVPRIPDE
jgi:hypothetical protein